MSAGARAFDPDAPWVGDLPPIEVAERLDQVEALVADGFTLQGAARSVGVKYRTLCNWRNRYAKAQGEVIARIKLLEIENARLRRAYLEIMDAAVNRKAGTRHFASPLD